VSPTSVSLLDRLKVARPDASDWGRLQETYLPLIARWLGRIPGLEGETDFTPATWEAFRLFAIDGLPAARVAEELGMNVNSVLQAKSRILRRLREEAGDILG
jgi:hypothetical protein